MAINPNPLILEKIQSKKLDKRHLCAKIEYKLEISKLQAASSMSKKSRLSACNLDSALIFWPEMVESNSGHSIFVQN